MSSATELLRTIRERGHWRVLIRPEPYAAKRVPDISNLLPILGQARVRLRGWDFPHLRAQAAVTLLDHIAQSTESGHHLEVLAFYQSGQFVHYSGFFDDWRDRSNSWPPDPQWAPHKWLGIGSTIHRFTEAFEFAARLAGTEAGSEAATVLVEVIGLEGRAFYIDDPKRLDTATLGLPAIRCFPYEVSVTRTGLLADARPLALKGVRELFKRCQVDISDRVLKDWQDEVGTTWAAR